MINRNFALDLSFALGSRCSLTIKEKLDEELLCTRENFKKEYRSTTDSLVSD